MFEKLHKYVGKSVESLVNRKDQPHVFRLHKKVLHFSLRPLRSPSQPLHRFPRLDCSPLCRPGHCALHPLSLPGAQRVYYVREEIMKRAISVRAQTPRPHSPPVNFAVALRQAAAHALALPVHTVSLPPSYPLISSHAPLAPLQVSRENLIAFGSSMGKFTHSGKFILTIGALDLIAQHAKYKVPALFAACMFYLHARRRRSWQGDHLARTCGVGHGEPMTTNQFSLQTDYTVTNNQI